MEEIKKKKDLLIGKFQPQAFLWRKNKLSLISGFSKGLIVKLFAQSPDKKYILNQMLL